MHAIIGKRVWVAGHAGLLGQSLVHAIERAEAKVLVASRAVLDLRDRQAVADWLAEARPDAAVIAAAKVGGVAAYETAPLDFLSDNARIALSITEAAAAARLPRLCFVASAAAYPKHAPQPLREESLMAGPLDPPHRTYGLAKLLGIEAVASARRQYRLDWFSVLPTNLYGPGGDSGVKHGQVVATLVARALAAQVMGEPELLVWGTGDVRRDFLHVDDCSEAIVRLLADNGGYEMVNIGSGSDVSIAELAELICNVTGYVGALRFDPDKPEGARQRLMDTSRLTMRGWRPRITLEEGIRALAASSELSNLGGAV